MINTGLCSSTHTTSLLPLRLPVVFWYRCWRKCFIFCICISFCRRGICYTFAISVLKLPFYLSSCCFLSIDDFFCLIYWFHCTDVLLFCVLFHSVTSQIYIHFSCFSKWSKRVASWSSTSDSPAVSSLYCLWRLAVKYVTHWTTFQGSSTSFCFASFHVKLVIFYFTSALLSWIQYQLKECQWQRTDYIHMMHSCCR